MFLLLLLDVDVDIFQALLAGVGGDFGPILSLSFDLILELSIFEVTRILHFVLGPIHLDIILTFDLDGAHLYVGGCFAQVHIVVVFEAFHDVVEVHGFAGREQSGDVD